MPLIIGIRAISIIIPRSPTKVPQIICSQTRHKHIPTPRIKTEITSYIMRTRFLPFIFGKLLFSILHHIIKVIIPKTSPTPPKITPCLKAFHSGRSAMHIPRANKTPLTVPIISATKLLFFILNLLSLFQHLCFYCEYSIMLFGLKNQSSKTQQVLE